MVAFLTSMVAFGSVPGLSELLNVTSSLTILNLRRTHLRAKGLESLNTTLQTCLTLQVLDLCDNHISAEGARHLSPVLGKCPNLRFLDLSENWIGVEGAEALAGVFAGCSALERLDLAHSCIETVSALAEGLSKCTRLKHLSVVGNHLEGESIGALVDSLAVCPELTSLCMNGNRVASEGAKLVGVRLPQFPKLTQLDMCDCELGASGMKNFAEGIARCGFPDLCTRSGIAWTDRELRFQPQRAVLVETQRQLHSGCWGALAGCQAFDLQAALAYQRQRQQDRGRGGMAVGSDAGQMPRVDFSPHPKQLSGRQRGPSDGLAPARIPEPP